MISQNSCKDVEFFKAEISRERIINLDFEYLRPRIEKYWHRNKDKYPLPWIKVGCTALFFKYIAEEDKQYFFKLGLAKHYIAGICIKNLFSIDSPELSFIVHESLSELFSLIDLKYPYEEHKTLYLKPSGENYRDWGNGYGEIIPHSDDLYEDFDVDLLSLTVCRDTTATPTSYLFPEALLSGLTNHELAHFLNIKVKFISGKNVSIVKSRERSIVDFSEKYGFRFFLDFRIDTVVGKRMLAYNSADEKILDKLRKSLESCYYQISEPKTGTFIILANYKVLHSRQKMNITESLAKHYGLQNSLKIAPRLLFRSKGPVRDYNVFS